MQVKFCGGARSVTGSAHLITINNGYKILMDFGLYQGSPKQDWEENNKWHFDPKSLDAVILSHAHIDHIGRLPQLIKHGFNGPIYCTHATRSLCAIMLLDSAKIQERDAEYHNKKLAKKKRKNRKSKFRIPLYTPEHVEALMNNFVGYGYDKWHKLNELISFKFNDAGHLLGSASINLKIKEGKKTIRLGFTGDVGRPDRPILRDPQLLEKSDYVICESTYGDKTHESNPEQSDRFLSIIKKACVKKKGKLIIPAFSVGRTQEIVYMLDKLSTAGKLPKIPIYVDSPLAVNATQVFGSHPECFDDQLNEYLLIDDNPFGFNELKYIRDVNQSKKLNDSQEPCVIISSSGMMTAGRIRHHVFNNIEKENTSILIVGYCAPNTLGGILKAGIKEVKLFGEMKQVNATIHLMDSFSAHADQKELLQHLAPLKKKAKKIFLVHGEYDTQKIFKKYLTKHNFKNIIIPDKGQEFVIN